LEDLVTIKGQTEYRIENASPDLEQKIKDLAAASGAKLVSTQIPRLTLEKIFLEATE
jgi:hypothetical protein